VKTARNEVRAGWGTSLRLPRVLTVLLEGERTMRKKMGYIPLLAGLFLVFACEYIVLPEEEVGGLSYGENKGWSALATNIGKSDSGDLHIELAIRNNTGEWSAMQAAAKPAVLNSGGKRTDCATVFVGSGGHRLAPGFQMRGYIGGKQSEPIVQMIFVECAGAEAAPGSTLSLDYSFVVGNYNYYEQDKNKGNGTLMVDLDKVDGALIYPVAESFEGLIHTSDQPIEALNKVVLTLLDIERSNDRLTFSWETANPGEYPTYVHVGNPPVIGNDGIIYGFYETPDIVSVPITPSGGKTDWTTEVKVPSTVTGLYILLSVETGKQRLFANYAVDITAQ
jgi:hypothetical protein